MRFPASSADLRNNLLSGQIRNRDGGTSSEASNLEMVTLADWEDWFADPAAADFTLVDGAVVVDAGVPLTVVRDDYCGSRRPSGLPDLGAVEYPSAPPSLPCATMLAGGGVDVFHEGFERGGVGGWSGRAP